LGTSLVTSSNWESIALKNRAHRNLQKTRNLCTPHRAKHPHRRHDISSRHATTSEATAKLRHVIDMVLRHAHSACPRVAYTHFAKLTALLHKRVKTHQNPHNYFPSIAILYRPSASIGHVLDLPFAKRITQIGVGVQTLSHF
jgi:hypothetical protein